MANLSTNVSTSGSGLSRSSGSHPRTSSGLDTTSTGTGSKGSPSFSDAGSKGSPSFSDAGSKGSPSFSDAGSKGSLLPPLLHPPLVRQYAVDGSENDPPLLHPPLVRQNAVDGSEDVPPCLPFLPFRREKATDEHLFPPSIRGINVGGIEDVQLAGPGTPQYPSVLDQIGNREKVSLQCLRTITWRDRDYPPATEEHYWRGEEWRYKISRTKMPWWQREQEYNNNFWLAYEEETGKSRKKAWGWIQEQDDIADDIKLADEDEVIPYPYSFLLPLPQEEAVGLSNLVDYDSQSDSGIDLTDVSDVSDVESIPINFDLCDGSYYCDCQAHTRERRNNRNYINGVIKCNRKVECMCSECYLAKKTNECFVLAETQLGGDVECRCFWCRHVDPYADGHDEECRCGFCIHDNCPFASNCNCHTIALRFYNESLAKNNEEDDEEDGEEDVEEDDGEEDADDDADDADDADGDDGDEENDYYTYDAPEIEEYWQLSSQKLSKCIKSYDAPVDPIDLNWKRLSPHCQYKSDTEYTPELCIEQLREAIDNFGLKLENVSRYDLPCLYYCGDNDAYSKLKEAKKSLHSLAMFNITVTEKELPRGPNEPEYDYDCRLQKASSEKFKELVSMLLPFLRNFRELLFVNRAEDFQDARNFVNEVAFFEVWVNEASKTDPTLKTVLPLFQNKALAERVYRKADEIFTKEEEREQFECGLSGEDDYEEDDDFGPRVIRTRQNRDNRSANQRRVPDEECSCTLSQLLASEKTLSFESFHAMVLNSDRCENCLKSFRFGFACFRALLLKDREDAQATEDAFFQREDEVSSTGYYTGLVELIATELTEYAKFRKTDPLSIVFIPPSEGMLLYGGANYANWPFVHSMSELPEARDPTSLHTAYLQMWASNDHVTELIFNQAVAKLVKLRANAPDMQPTVSATPLKNLKKKVVKKKVVKKKVVKKKVVKKKVPSAKTTPVLVSKKVKKNLVRKASKKVQTNALKKAAQDKSQHMSLDPCNDLETETL
jgi:hypothetical protein